MPISKEIFAEISSIDYSLLNSSSSAPFRLRQFERKGILLFLIAGLLGIIFVFQSGYYNKNFDKYEEVLLKKNLINTSNLSPKEAALRNDYIRKINNSLPYLGPDYVTPFINYKQTFMEYGAKHNMASCIIEKCMSTLMVGVNCYIQHQKLFKPLNITINDGWAKAGFCLGDTYTNLSDLTFDVPTEFYSGMRLFAIIRNPIERFLSAFYNKCIYELRLPRFVHCYGCGTNMSCVVQNIYKNMMAMGPNQLSPVTYTDRHFAPLSWYCNFRDHMNDFTLIDGSGKNKQDKDNFLNSLFKVFREQNVAESILKGIWSQATGGHTKHTSTGTHAKVDWEQEMMKDPEILRTLKKIYYYDYLIFGYDTSIFDGIED